MRSWQNDVGRLKIVPLLKSDDEPAVAYIARGNVVHIN